MTLAAWWPVSAALAIPGARATAAGGDDRLVRHPRHREQRNALMAAHKPMMQNGMQMMSGAGPGAGPHGMAGMGAGMGSGMGPGGAGPGAMHGSAGAPADWAAKQQWMETRMEMMQSMMQLMVDRLPPEPVKK
ncbi:MAG: hypothetical protein ABIR94_12110 [Rubrivivax sp.]